MTLHAFETLPSSAARFKSPSLFLMIRALLCSMAGLPFHLLGFDRASQPLSKRVTLLFATQQCQIRSKLLQLIPTSLCRHVSSRYSPARSSTTRVKIHENLFCRCGKNHCCNRSNDQDGRRRQRPNYRAKSTHARPSHLV